MEDRQIVELYLARDESALARTAEKYGPALRALAENLLEDPQTAEECENDVYLAAWNAIPPHRPRKLPAFLGKITRSIACDAVRSRTARKRGGGEYMAALEELGECVPPSPGADQAVLDRELEALVNRFLGGLPARECNVFLRRYWYGVPVKELAAERGEGANALSQRLLRLRKALRAFLESEGVEG